MLVVHRMCMYVCGNGNGKLPPKNKDIRIINYASKY